MNEDEFVDALEKIYNMTKEERVEMGMKGKNHVEKNYNFKEYVVKWDVLLKDIHDRYGSWDSRKEYKNWKILEV